MIFLASVVPTNHLMGPLRPLGPVAALQHPDQAPPPQMDPLATPQTAAAATNSHLKEPTSAGRHETHSRIISSEMGN